MTHAALKDLLPCPFCGRNDAARIRKTKDGQRVVVCDASTRNRLNGCGGSCGYQNSRAEAIAAWNRRSALSAMEGEAVCGACLGRGKRDVAHGETSSCERCAGSGIVTAPPPQQAADVVAESWAHVISVLAEVMPAGYFDTIDGTSGAEKAIAAIRALATQPQQAGGDAVAALPEYWRGLAILNDAVIAHVLRDVAKQLEAALSTPPQPEAGGGVTDAMVKAAKAAAMSIKHNKEPWFPMTERRLKAAIRAALSTTPASGGEHG